MNERQELKQQDDVIGALVCDRDSICKVLVESQIERGGLAHQYVEIFEVAVHGAAPTDDCTHRPPERSSIVIEK